MERLLEDISEGSEVERFIWNKLAISCGNFEGMYKFSIEDLFILKSFIYTELLVRVAERKLE